MKKFIFTAASILLTVTSLFSKVYAHFDPDLIREAGLPIFTRKSIIITLPPEAGYQIFIRSDIDEWRTNYHFKRSFSGIYYCEIPYDFNRSSVRYRMNINGFWETNPMGGEVETDEYGNSFSVLHYPSEIEYHRNPPVIKSSESTGNRVVFRFFAPEAQSVSLMFSGDKYSRFRNVLHKLPNGFWEIEMLVEDGIYMYYFIADGKKHIDNYNSRLITDPVLGSLSLIKVNASN